MATQVSQSGSPANQRSNAVVGKELPSPQELPDAEVVIFDGDCKFCTAQVRQLQKLDGKNRLAFVSLHDPFVRESYRDLSHEMMMEQMYLITKDHRRLGGAEAVRHLSLKLPKLWLLAPILHLPGSMPLWRFLYRQIAKRRYQLAGRFSDDACDDGTCSIHYGE